MRVQKIAAYIPVSREMLEDAAGMTPVKAHLGASVDVALGMTPGEAVAHQARLTGYVIADRPTWPTFDLFPRLSRLVARWSRRRAT